MDRGVTLRAVLFLGISHYLHHVPAVPMMVLNAAFPRHVEFGQSFVMSFIKSPKQAPRHAKLAPTMAVNGKVFI
jgi:hypothetical protein